MRHLLRDAVAAAAAAGNIWSRSSALTSAFQLRLAHFPCDFSTVCKNLFRAAQSATAVRWNRLVRVVECRKSRQKRAKKLSSAGPTTITLLYRSPIPSSPLNLGTVEYNKKVPAKRVEIKVESIKYAV